MARKIDVVNSRGMQMKKCIAQLLVRRALAEWVIENVSIKLRDIKAAPKNFSSCRQPVTPKLYIPETLPPAEIENTRFVLPSADRTHSFIMSLALAGCPGYAEFA